MQDWLSFFRTVRLIETICSKLSYHAEISGTDSLFRTQLLSIEKRQLAEGGTQI